MLEGAYKLLRDSAVPFVIAELHPFALEKMEHSQETLHTYMKKKLPFQLFLAYLEEVLRISDRVLVMDKGILAGQLNRDQLTEEVVMHLATGTT